MHDVLKTPPPNSLTLVSKGGVLVSSSWICPYLSDAFATNRLQWKWCSVACKSSQRRSCGSTQFLWPAHYSNTTLLERTQGGVLVDGLAEHEASSRSQLPVIWLSHLKCSIQLNFQMSSPRGQLTSTTWEMPWKSSLVKPFLNSWAIKSLAK